MERDESLHARMGKEIVFPHSNVYCDLVICCFLKLQLRLEHIMQLLKSVLILKH